MKINEIRAAFNAEDDRLAAIREAELLVDIDAYGNPFTVCTNGAEWLQQTFFPKSKVVGYSIENNPTALIGQEIYGHDFLLVDDRTIIDFWYADICCNKEAPVMLDVFAQPDLVAKYYGNPTTWEVVREPIIAVAP